ncbi:MAG: N-acetylmuramoyl-L-alanine amidase [bacterium]
MNRVRRLLFLAVFLGSACAKPAPNLSVMGSKPDWNSLAPFAEAVSPAEFQRLMNQVYSRDGSWADFFRLEGNTLEVKAPGFADGLVRVPLAAEGMPAKIPPRYWRAAPLQHPTPKRPLAGLRIALDPGHLGGAWARMERRWFRPEGQAPIAEGDLTLGVARQLKKRLEALGAEVYLTRDSADPATALRPEDLRGIAAEALDRRQDLNLESPAAFSNLPREEQIQRISELLFYRVAELRARAARVNEKFQPDLTLCLHFNAADWGDPEHPKPATGNHLHVLIPGAVEAGEWALDDVRFEMLRRLLDGSHRVELSLAETIANSLSARTGLPPALVPGGSVKKVGDNPYLWSRNLLANRLFENPTVFVEAYVMNHPHVIARLEAGDFEGRRNIGDQEVSSLYRDYAEGLAQGILAYFQKNDE